MSKYIWILFIALLHSGFLSAQDEVAKSYLEFDREIIDLGQVPRDTLIDMVYTFKNISQEALEVDMVSTCLCSEAVWPWKKIQPGESGDIKVTFDTSKKDSAEPITLDVNLVNADPKTGIPIFKTLSYTFTFPGS